MKRKYHRENCKNCIRMTFIDQLGRKIILSGIHAFEWEVSILHNNNLTTVKFANRIEATKEFNKYKIKKR